MPYGVLTDIFCIILGGIIGPNLNIKITYKYREPLIKIFGISALAIGIVSFIKVNCLPCVILALILGFILGEFFDLDTKLKNLLAKIIYKLNFKEEIQNGKQRNSLTERRTEKETGYYIGRKLCRGKQGI